MPQRKSKQIPEVALAESGGTHATDQPGSKAFPIVGIGASAGGLAAFEAFFNGMPADMEPGMAFVLVQHLAPDHDSILSALVQRHTRMQVFAVEDGMEIKINCAYIIPPNRDMAVLNGALHLLEPTAPKGHRLPVDFLFRSLAEDQHERAIGIVLSGTGSDGTLGVRAIKRAGGMIMAQNLASTEYDGMPRSAITTGLVDYQLPPAEMATQLMAYAAHVFGRSARPVLSEVPQSDSALKKIFILLRTHTGHDFSQYKPSTINRRIERRMAVHEINDVEDYVRYLQQTPSEVESLFCDLLIGVTGFFRDTEAFKALEEQVIPKLFEGKHDGSVVRAWSTGCSTGEEAYSIAILLQEQLDRLRSPCKVQVFATDIDSRAIATARAGVYPASIASNITPERLARYFTVEPDGNAYRVRKVIRDMLVFSEQDVIKDPPFSRLDLITCRNLMIYLSSELQKKLISLFHYALAPGGMLFLGTSETVGDFSNLFEVVDRRCKIYRRNEDFLGAKQMALDRYLAHSPVRVATDASQRAASNKMAGSQKQSMQELTERALLEHLAVTGALVNGQGDIFYLHGRTGMFLEPAPGDTGVSNILKMARQGLQNELATALHKATRSKERVDVHCIQVKTNGHFSAVSLSICGVNSAPASPLDSPLYLVLLQLAPEDVGRGRTLASAPAGQLADPNAGLNADAIARISELTEELKARDGHLHVVNEELETSNEDLKSSNEEMQSVNEELQSTNEELETSKEELQSINEELTTVNTELQSKVSDLSRVNNDMNNLLAGTGIGTIFVDHQLNIMRFTPAVRQIINLILSDVGRPVGHIVSNLVGYDSLVVDTQQVLDTLVPTQTDVQTRDGKFYSLHILPYRTLDNVIEGAVITFVDITDMVLIREALRKANELLHPVVVQPG